MQELWYVDGGRNFDNLNRRLAEGWKVKIMVPTSIAIRSEGDFPTTGVDYYEGGVYVVIERDD